MDTSRLYKQSIIRKKANASKFRRLRINSSLQKPPITVHGKIPTLINDNPCPVYACYLIMHTHTSHSGRMVYPIDKKCALGIFCNDVTTQYKVLKMVECNRAIHHGSDKPLISVDLYFVPWSLVQMIMSARTSDKHVTFNHNSYCNKSNSIYSQVTDTCNVFGWPKQVEAWLLLNSIAKCIHTNTVYSPRHYCSLHV